MDPLVPAAAAAASAAFLAASGYLKVTSRSSMAPWTSGRTKPPRGEGGSLKLIFFSKKVFRGRGFDQFFLKLLSFRFGAQRKRKKIQREKQRKARRKKKQKRRKLSPVDHGQQPPGRGPPERQRLARGNRLRERESGRHGGEQRVDDVASRPLPGGDGDAAAVPEGEGVAGLVGWIGGFEKCGGEKKTLSFFFFFSRPPTSTSSRKKPRRKNESLSLTPPKTAPTSPPATGPAATRAPSPVPPTARTASRRNRPSATACRRRKPSAPPAAPLPRRPRAASRSARARRRRGGWRSPRARWRGP